MSIADVIGMPHDRSHLPYRTNVGAILRRHDDLVLLCERLAPREVWQFPQGGVDPGETHDDALWRELTEELGLQRPRRSCRMVGRGPATNYDFADDYEAPITKRFRGQTQTLFLLDFLGTDDEFDLGHHHDPEFADFEWVSRDEALARMWSVKRGVLLATIEALAEVFEAGFTGPTASR